jgi:hypothetical protein
VKYIGKQENGIETDKQIYEQEENPMLLAGLMFRIYLLFRIKKKYAESITLNEYIIRYFGKNIVGKEK